MKVENLKLNTVYLYIAGDNKVMYMGFEPKGYAFKLWSEKEKKCIGAKRWFSVPSVQYFIEETSNN